MTDIKSRTTLYKGIQMRSRLEADFAAFLDKMNADWQYEPVCFAGPGGQWLPDFRVQDGENVVYFEVKPESLPSDDWDPTLERMTVTWLTEPSAHLHLVLWAYGEPTRCISLMGVPADRDDGLTWWYSEGGDEFHAWPGMGQLEHLCELVRQEEEAKKAKSS